MKHPAIQLNHHGIRIQGMFEMLTTHDIKVELSYPYRGVKTTWHLHDFERLTYDGDCERQARQELLDLFELTEYVQQNRTRIITAHAQLEADCERIGQTMLNAHFYLIGQHDLKQRLNEGQMTRHEYQAAHHQLHQRHEQYRTAREQVRHAFLHKQLPDEFQSFEYDTFLMALRAQVLQ
jgi:hypothetical protein